MVLELLTVSNWGTDAGTYRIITLPRIWEAEDRSCLHLKFEPCDLVPQPP
ncbi:hypothetical protein Poly30_15970 [Planctomycetes bacterium Poly30]|uniref:Uncharacterized protein n=1 Tax=Saltatorellus ferox TaxID=2528018 RepID=A0A518EPS9_9BACT|nr:hypothetical protein Poly30_15970 [Planctomycetes bacterium Poly30]